MSHRPEPRRAGFRFGDFVIDLQGVRLLHGDAAVHLEPKAFRVLLWLIERRGEVVGREELLENVWEEAFVSENALTRAVTRLRQALGDDSHQPRYVETVPTFGYRFVAEVEELSGTEVPALFPGAEPAASARRHAGRRAARGAVALASVLLVGLAAYKVWLVVRAPESGKRAAALPTRLAVLPLRNLGPPDQEYLVDGIHEELIADLSKIPGLRVISRTTAMHYRETSRSLPEISRELGVDYVVEGSVLREGSRIRVTSQLIDGESDEHLWNERYDRDLESALTMVSEVARTITGEIEIVLAPEAEALLARRPVRPEVQEAYLKARYHFNRFGRREIKKALELYLEAIRLDAEFAPAHAGLASAYMIQGLLGLESPEEMALKVKEAAARALELDPSLDDAMGALGWTLLYYDRDWDAAERALRKALAINPSNALTRHGYSDYLTVVGRVDEAVEQVRRGRQCDPMAPIANRPMTYHLILARRFDEAIAEGRRLLAANLGSAAVRYDVGRALWHKGLRDKALATFTEAWKEDAEIVHALDEGRREGGAYGALKAMAETLARRHDPHLARAVLIAGCYAGAGEVDLALEWLERANEVHRPLLLFLRTNPDFDPLRGDPRFEDLMRRIGLPP